MAEVPQMEMRARISADTAQFTRGMQQASQAAEGFIQTSNRLRGAMVGVGVASGAAITAMVAFGTKAFMAAARVDELDIAMNAVGKSTGLGYQVIKDATLAIKSNGIEMEIAQKSALKFAQNNLELGKAADLARVAQDLAVISGMNSSDTYNMLTHAVITGRSEVLKSVGIQKSAGQMYESFARSIGKTTKQLTYQEKQQAVLSGALTEGAKVAGTYEAAMTSPGKVLRSFARVNNEIQVAVGGVLLKAFGPLIFSAYNLVKSFAKAVEKSETLQTIFKATTLVLKKLTEPFIVVIDKIKEFVDNLDPVVAVGEKFEGVMSGAQDKVKGLAEKIEFLLPAVAAVAAAFATFAGAQIFKMIPIFGTILGGLAGPLGIVAVVMATLYLTSSQVKDAMNDLFRALTPVAEAVKKVGAAFVVAGAYSVSLFSFAIKGLAKVISGTNDFLNRNRFLMIALKSVLMGVAFAFVALKAVTIAQGIAAKVSAGFTALQNKLLNTQAIMSARAGVATATLGVFNAQAAVATATHNVAIAQQAVLAGGGATAVAGLTAAQSVLTASQAGATAAANTLAGANARLAVATNAVLAPILIKVALLAGLVIAFVYAWKESETFREVMTKVFNFVANVVGKVLGFIFKLFGNLLIGFANLIDINNTFGKVVASVIQFVYNTYLTWYIFIIGAIKTVIDTFLKLFENQTAFAKIVAGVINFIIGVYATFYSFILGTVKSIIDAFVNLFKTNETFRKIVETVFNAIQAIIGFAVTTIVVILANIIKVIATLIYYFGKFRDFIADVWGKITLAIDKAKDIIGKVLGTLSNIMSGVVSFMREKFASFISWLAGLAANIPAALGGNYIRDALQGIANAISGVKKAEEEFKPSMGEDISKTAITGIDAASKLNSKIIEASLSWGKYKGGAAGALSDVADKMLGFAAKVNKIAADEVGNKLVTGFITAGEKTSSVLGTMMKGLTALKEMKFGDKVIDGLVKAANVASDGLGKVLSGLEKMKDLKVGEFIVKNTSDAALKAGEFLLGLGAGIESFTESDFVNKIGDAFGDLLGKLKTGLGFGNILEDLKKEFSKPGDLNFDDPNADEIASGAKRLETIRDSMKAGIDAIRGVLDDLKQAAKDFADSLKDTIVNFAGLKGVELPDGFIPKAKSLITNMEQRLNKSQQFAAQIAQLQAMNLDADALKSIIEEGPIKGAQLAASILGGGQEAVNEVSRLQRQIQFAGARIGAFGAEAGFSGQISDATRILNSMEGKDFQTASRGNNVYIQQGAFQLNVDVSGAKDDEERTAIIAAKIEETFAILARQLASK
jgi:phage-related protein